MSQHSTQPPEVPLFLIKLFRPARWCRQQWPFLWFKALSAGIVVVVLFSVFGSWSGCSARRSWENWLDNFRFSGSSMKNPHAKFGAQRTRDPSDREPLPTYLGDGKAELGDYSIRVFDPITQSELRTDFRLEGMTSLGDQTSFEQFMRCNRRFFREQVAVVLRTHNLDDLTDPDLNLLGRKIVARVNRSLGERVLKSAEIKNFALYESINQSGFVLWEPEEASGVP
ncbi:MAG: hypothetical protein RBS80_05530 [Thermoguttaceae bacterium]|jgi:hypothetical protein|nr:hypothetical protein [Thermoguttaceae bacterium]